MGPEVRIRAGCGAGFSFFAPLPPLWDLEPGGASPEEEEPRQLCCWARLAPALHANLHVLFGIGQDPR